MSHTRYTRTFFGHEVWPETKSVNEQVTRVKRRHQHITGHFREQSLQAFTYWQTNWNDQQTTTTTISRPFATTTWL